MKEIVERFELALTCVHAFEKLEPVPLEPADACARAGEALEFLDELLAAAGIVQVLQGLGVHDSYLFSFTLVVPASGGSPGRALGPTSACG